MQESGSSEKEHWWENWWDLTKTYSLATGIINVLLLITIPCMGSDVRGVGEFCITFATFLLV